MCAKILNKIQNKIGNRTQNKIRGRGSSMGFKVRGRRMEGRHWKMLRFILGGGDPAEFPKIKRNYVMSKEALARRLGISAVSLGRWERNQTHPTGIAVRAISTRLVEKYFDVLFPVKRGNMKNPNKTGAKTP